jgi:uncharacterized membrane protein
MAVSAEFVIRPNAAFNTRSWPWVFGLLALICLTIGIRFAVMGYWMILPFAVIDVVAVGLILVMLMRRHAYVEKILIDADNLVIRHIQRKNRRSWHFPLHWVRVRLSSPTHEWYARRLLVGSKGEWVEIGQCLTESERESLAGALKDEIRRYNDTAHLTQ